MCEITDQDVKVSSQAAARAASTEIEEIVAQKGSVGPSTVLDIKKEKQNIINMLKTYFPGSMPGEEMLDCVKRAMEENGYTDENTLFAQSVCPDEVNHEDGDITDLFIKHLGEVFHLGGLAGLPFTGKTGFKAFSSHVPDKGNCFVLMAPHIGLDEEGNLGSYTRAGQAGSGSCCGAAVGALKYCASCGDAPDEASMTPEDYQMQYIIQQVHKCKDKLLAIEDKNRQQVELVGELYKSSNDMLNKIVHANFGCEESTLMVLSGIQINMPRPFQDFFQPREFYLMRMDGTRVDLIGHCRPD